VDRAITRAIETGSTANKDAKAFLAALRRWKLVPLAAQVPVCCGKARLATAIDVIATDARGRCVVLEVKCGYDGTFEPRGAPTARRRACLSRLAIQASPLMFAFVQALAGAQMYESNAGVRVASIGVVQITRDAITLHPLPRTLPRRKLWKLLARV